MHAPLPQHVFFFSFLWANPLPPRRWEGEQRVSLDELAAHALPLVPRLNRLEVASVLWAYASMRHVHPGGALCRAVLRCATLCHAVLRCAAP